MSQSTSLKIDASRPQLEGFQEYYDKEIAPWLQEQKDRQEAARKHQRLIGGVGLALAPILIWAYIALGVHNFFGASWELPVTLIIVYAAVVLIWASSPLRRLKGEVKDFLVQGVCDFLGLNYDPRAQDFPLEVFRETHLVPRHGSRTLRHRISGRYDEVDFSVAECEITQTSSSGETTTTTTVFHGLLFHLSCPREFRGQTVVGRDAGRLNTFLRNLGNRGKQVKLDDPRFEKLFNVYSTDEEEARALLTQPLLERVMALAEHVGEKAMELAFVDNKLLLTNRVTQSPLNKGSDLSVTDSRRVELMLEEICLIYDVIDVMHLEGLAQ